MNKQYKNTSLYSASGDLDDRAMEGAGELEATSRNHLSGSHTSGL